MSNIVVVWICAFLLLACSSSDADQPMGGAPSAGEGGAAGTSGAGGAAGVAGGAGAGQGGGGGAGGTMADDGGLDAASDAAVQDDGAVDGGDPDSGGEIDIDIPEGSWLVGVRSPAENASVLAVALAPDGSSYVTGSFTTSATLESSDGDHQSVTATAGFSHMFLARYDALGVLRWAVPIEGSSSSMGSALAVMKDGGVVLTGACAPMTRFGQAMQEPHVLESDGAFCGAFLARYSADGAVLWAAGSASESTSWGAGQALAVTSDAIYLAGMASENTVLATTAGAGATLSGSNNGGGFLARYDHAGELEWAVEIAGGESAMRSVVVSEGAVFVGGHFRGTGTFESNGGGSAMRMSGNNYEDGFVARYDMAGHLAWVNAIGSIPAVASWARIHALTVDSAGRIVAAGVGVGSGDENTISFQHTSGAPTQDEDSCFVVSYSSDGAVERLHALAGEPFAVAAQGNDVLVGGSYRWLESFEGASGSALTVPLPSDDSYDGFIAELDAVGAVSSVLRASSETDQVVLGLAVNRVAVHAVGTYSGGLEVGGMTLEGAAQSRGFIARLPR
jgi:hypothetical protein